MGITLDMATTTSAGGGPFYVKYTASGSHLLQIDGYSITKHAPNGTSLKSCPFTVGGYRWMLHLFPNGDRPESSGFISIFICLYKCFERRRVSLQVELSFIDEVDKQNRAHVRTRQVLDLYGNYGVGYRRFIAREALENSKHLRVIASHSGVTSSSRGTLISRRIVPATVTGSAGLATSGR
jgi:hypothetical protein